MLPIIKSMYPLQNQCFLSSAVGEFEKMLNLYSFIIGLEMILY